MARTSILFILLLIIGSSQAQTYFYIDAISVVPASPNTSDAITISLIGGLSSTGAHVVSATHMLMGNTVHITVIAADPGGGDVIVPHTEEIEIGSLPAGPYGILVDGAFILDSAPEFEHSFNVSEVGVGAFCDDLDVISIGWHPFTDTLLVVHVTNTLEHTAFSYPGFVLLDANGDTLALETVVHQGIGSDSRHILRIHEDAVVPEGIFQGTLHLWTGFYTEFACELERTIDLCPATWCVIVYPNLGNFGNGLAIGTYTWTITYFGGIVTQRQFELTPELQSDQDEVCLPPGSYEMTMVFDQEPTGGQLIFGINGEGFVPGPTQNLFFGTPSTMPFDLLAQCAEGTNAIEEGEVFRPLLVTTTAGSILVTDRTGAQLGTVILYDAVGKEIARTKTSNDRVEFDVATDGMYLLRTTSAVEKVIVERR